jgi:hypothetical protein
MLLGMVEKISLHLLLQMSVNSCIDSTQVTLEICLKQKNLLLTLFLFHGNPWAFLFVRIFNQKLL